jgi:hypothetical protein
MFLISIFNTKLVKICNNKYNCRIYMIFTMLFNFFYNKNYAVILFLLYNVSLSCNASEAVKIAPSSDPIYEVAVDPVLLASDNGSLNEKTTIIFLQKAYQQGILLKEAPDFPDPTCIQAKELGSKGANTLKLFAIQVSPACLEDHNPIHEDYATQFILKEMGRNDEAMNLHKVKNSELVGLAPGKNKSGQDNLPTLAFQHHNLSYKDLNKKTHVLSLLHAAKGEEMKYLHNQLAIYHKYDTTNLPQYTYTKEFLTNAFYSTGRSLGAMHYKYMEPKGAIFGLTHVHADLHMENVFFDGKEVTFIDNETFVISLREKQSILVDVTRFIGFTISHPSARYQHSADIPAEVWREVAVEPFIKGYIAGYPADKKNQVTTKLKDLLLNLSAGELGTLWRFPADAALWETAKEKYLRPIFSKLG